MYYEAKAFLECAEFCHEELVKSGGFTLHPTAPTLWFPRTGYFVGVDAHRSIQVEGVATPEDIADWLLLRHEQRDNRLLGCWYDPRVNRTYFDYAVHIADRPTAELIGSAESQVSIYDCEARAEILLNPR